MAHHVTSADIPADGEHLDRSKIAGVKMICGGIAAIGTLASFGLLFWGPQKLASSYAYSWLFALFFFMTIAIGGCFWTILHNVSNSGWGTSVRRQMENIGSVFPWLAIFAIPLLVPSVQHWLYEWMNIHRQGLHAPNVGLFDGNVMGYYGSKSLDNWFMENHHSLLRNKSWYMNLVAWYIRFAFFFIGLGIAITTLRKYSVRQDTDPNPGTKNLFAARKAACWCLPIMAITITFTGFDWLMGLDYTWFSTMWGVYLFAGAALNSMAVLILVINWLRKHGYLHKVVNGEHYHIMGKLLLAFTIFWAYIAFSQFFLIWYANITEETKYFLIRNTEGWNIANITLVFGHFVVPFVILLQAWLKKNPFWIGLMCVYTLVMHVLDHYLIVVPERSISLRNILPEVYGHTTTTVPGAFWGDILAFVVIGCGFMFFLLRAIGQHSLFPHRDPRILESANVSN